jgi:hypothetical protein
MLKLELEDSWQLLPGDSEPPRWRTDLLLCRILIDQYKPTYNARGASLFGVCKRTRSSKPLPRGVRGRDRETISPRLPS